MEPQAAAVSNPQGRSPYVLTCEHASNYIPAGYAALGLAPADLQRHIAWDIGAAEVARAVAAALDAPLICSGYSRLLIDCNRPLGVASSIPQKSEATMIPGNLNLDAAERQRRADSFYWPFQQAVSSLLDRRQAEARPTIVIGMHSFTPVFMGDVRPMQAGILFRKSVRFGEALRAALDAPSLMVCANEPYAISDSSDYTVPVHGEARGLEAVLVEIRQDLIAHSAGAASWAQRMIAALNAVQPFAD